MKIYGCYKDDDLMPLITGLTCGADLIWLKLHFQQMWPFFFDFQN